MNVDYNPWDEVAKNLASKKAIPFFDRIYAEIANLYKELDQPNGPGNESLWAWCFEQLSEARSRLMEEEEHKRKQIAKQLRNTK